MKHQPEMIEGPEAFKRFQDPMRHVLSVPREVVQRKIKEHQEAAAKNPNRSGQSRKRNSLDPSSKDIH